MGDIKHAKKDQTLASERQDATNARFRACLFNLALSMALVTACPSCFLRLSHVLVLQSQRGPGESESDASIVRGLSHMTFTQKEERVKKYPKFADQQYLNFADKGERGSKKIPIVFDVMYGSSLISSLAAARRKTKFPGTHVMH